MELEKFKDANRNELSMIEVAHAILNEHGKEMVFADLVNEIQTFLGKAIKKFVIVCLNFIWISILTAASSH